MYLNKVPTPSWRQTFWRDIDSSSLRNELLLKIALVTAGLIVLAGCAVACYYLTSTTQTVSAFGTTGHWEQTARGGQRLFYDIIGTEQASNAPFMVFPLLFGTPLGIASFIGSHFINFERRHKRRREKWDLPWYNERLYYLTKKNFSDAYAFLNGHGGLGPLVRSGLLSVEQGNTLKDLFTDHEKGQDVTTRWTDFQESLSVKSEEI